MQALSLAFETEGPRGQAAVLKCAMAYERYLDGGHVLGPELAEPETKLSTIEKANLYQKMADDLRAQDAELRSRPIRNMPSPVGL